MHRDRRGKDGPNHLGLFTGAVRAMMNSLVNESDQWTYLLYVLTVRVEGIAELGPPWPKLREAQRKRQERIKI